MFAITPFLIFGQLNSDIEFIRKNCCAKIDSTRFDEEPIFKDSCLVDFVINNFEDSEQYIHSRNDASMIETIFCNDTLYIAKDFSEKNPIEIKIKKEKILVSEEKNIKFNSTNDDKTISEIKGLYPIGLWGKNPMETSRIKDIAIKINDEHIKIPKHAYNDLFEPNFCNVFYPMRPIEFHVSKDEKHYYLYIYGNSGITIEDTSYMLPTNYIAKLVFDDKGYKKRIIVTYPVLQSYDISRLGFIGF